MSSKNALICGSSYTPSISYNYSSAIPQSHIQHGFNRSYPITTASHSSQQNSIAHRSNQPSSTPISTFRHQPYRSPPQNQLDNSSNSSRNLAHHKIVDLPINSQLQQLSNLLRVCPVFNEGKDHKKGKKQKQQNQDWTLNHMTMCNARQSCNEEYCATYSRFILLWIFCTRKYCLICHQLKHGHTPSVDSMKNHQAGSSASLYQRIPRLLVRNSQQLSVTNESMNYNQSIAMQGTIKTSLLTKLIIGSQDQKEETGFPMNKDNYEVTNETNPGTNYSNNYEIFNDIPENIKIIIKMFHVFNDSDNKKNIIFITEKDEVYGLGNNGSGILGLGHNRKVVKCTEIKELKEQKIIAFYIGYDFVLGLNIINMLFGWGKNQCGQLGLGFISVNYQYFKPQKIEFAKNIQDVCCGSYHTLVLMSDGFIYGWGESQFGQLGLPSETFAEKFFNFFKPGKFIYKPTKLKIEETYEFEFKYIYCKKSSSFVISKEGQLFTFGFNLNGILGQENNNKVCYPQKIDLFNVQKIFSDGIISYFLTNEGSVYYCCISQMRPKKLDDFNAQGRNINTLAKIWDNTIDDFFCCQDTEKMDYELDDPIIKMVDQNMSFLNEMHSEYSKITSKTVQAEDYNQLALEPLKIPAQNETYKLQAIIGLGGFGIVGKFWNINDKKNYAIKMIEMNNDNSVNETNKEIQTMAKLLSHFIVRYYESWEQNNCLFIKMEYCPHNLRNILRFKSIAFERKDNQPMKPIEYFISCKIFHQITEGLNYLHSLKPKPLIHRDLKPENILIGKYRNKQICKLADFGLSKFIDNFPDQHSRITATHKYSAPEIVNGDKYDTRADVWSLGIIGLEIFNLDREIQFQWNSPFTNIFPGIHEQKLKLCDHILAKKLLTRKLSQRITCSDVLVEIENFQISKEFLNKRDIIFFSNRFEMTNLLYFADMLRD